MSTAPEPRPLTHADLDDTPHDGNRYEVIDGVLHISPFPSHRHQHAVGRIFLRLSLHVMEHDLGEVFPSGLKVVLDVPTGVGPDVVFVSRPRMVHMQEDGLHGIPDLVVEVVSSRPNLDRVIKLGSYASAGIPHYWIADPKQRRIDEFVLRGDRYVAGASATGGWFEPESPTGFRLDASELWLP